MYKYDISVSQIESIMALPFSHKKLDNVIGNLELILFKTFSAKICPFHENRKKFN